MPGVFEEVDGVLHIYGRTGRLTARNGGPRPGQCRAIRSGLLTLSALAPVLMKLVDAGALLRRPSQHQAECEALPAMHQRAVRTAALVARREAMHPAAFDNVGIELAGTVRPLPPSLPLPSSLALDVEVIQCRFRSKRAQRYTRSQLFPSTFK